MIHTVIWLTVLGIALLVPNVLAVRLALAGAGEAPAVSSGAKVIVPARRRVKRASPQLARRGYLWKALSPLIFGVTVILGLAVGGAAGYAIMGAGLLNLLWGFWGWDGYTPGEKGKR